MTEGMKVTVDRRQGIAVIYTDGYINTHGGEEIAKVAYELIEEGYGSLLVNLEKTKLVTSVGISILFEIIARMSEIEGNLAFCNLTPTIDKTFHIMDVSQYSSIYPDEASALDQAQAAG